MDKIARLAQIARPELGDQIPLTVFRAFRHFSSDYLERLVGRSVEAVFQHGGRELGKEVGTALMKPDLDAYLRSIQQWVREAKVGLLRPVHADAEKLVVRLDECITCAGMSSVGKRICYFEVGLVAGAVEVFVKRKVRAAETQCNANGEETCEVTVNLAAAA